jgi:hypothetical protein
MKAAELYTGIKEALGPDLKEKEINKGESFFWREVRVGPASTRVLRVHEDALGSVTEIKLPVTSNRTDAEVFLPLPTTVADVIAATRREIELLER